MTVRIKLETWIAVPPRRLFDLSLLADLHIDSMTKYRERAIGGVRTGALTLGDSVTWRAWHFGVPWKMTSKIVAVEAPEMFVDEQVRGPFKTFRHEHRFRRDGVGTSMTDIVEFRAPLGLVGRLLERVVLARYVDGLIRERNRFLRERAEGRDGLPHL